MSEIAGSDVADRPTSSAKSSPWAKVTSLSGLLVGLGSVSGICLYLTGHVAHITELRDKGAPSDLFPRGVEWTTINGYYAVFSEWTRTLRDIPWSLVLLALVLLAFALWVYWLPTPKIRATWLNGLPKWLRGVLRAILMSAVTIFVIFYLFLLFSLIALIPAYIGERAGHYTAQKDLALYRDATPADAPATLWKEDKQIMRGYVVAASPELISFYDVDEHSVRTIDRQGIEMRSRLPNKRDLASGKYEAE